MIEGNTSKWAKIDPPSPVTFLFYSLICSHLQIVAKNRTKVFAKTFVYSYIITIFASEFIDKVARPVKRGYLPVFAQSTCSSVALSSYPRMMIPDQTTTTKMHYRSAVMVGAGGRRDRMPSNNIRSCDVEMKYCTKTDGNTAGSIAQGDLNTADKLKTFKGCKTWYTINTPVLLWAGFESRCNRHTFYLLTN